MRVKKWNWLKKFMQVRVDVNACTPILMGMASLVLEIKLALIWPNFRPWTIVHEGQKIESAQKIYASRDVKCMQNNFGRCGLSGF